MTTFSEHLIELRMLIRSLSESLVESRRRLIQRFRCEFLQFTPANTSRTRKLPRRRYFPQPEVNAQATTPGQAPPHHHPYRVRIAFHTRSNDCRSIIERAHDERNHFQGSGRVGDRAPRVAAEAATRG